MKGKAMLYSKDWDLMVHVERRLTALQTKRAHCAHFSVTEVALAGLITTMHYQMHIFLASSIS